MVEQAVNAAKEAGIECIIFCDTAHVFEKEGAKTVTVSQGKDSVDFALVNAVQKGDIVITQDYGLAAMCLARGAVPLNQDGMVYSDKNIGTLLTSRHISQKVRRGGGRIKGPQKRKANQNDKFLKALKAQF